MGDKMSDYEQMGRKQTHEVLTREPGRLVQLIRNACRDLPFETVRDTVTVNKDTPREFGAIDGEIVLEGTHETEHRTPRESLLDRVTGVLSFVWLSTVAVVVLSQSPATVAGVVVAATLAGLVWLRHTSPRERLSYSHRIEVTLHGEAATEQPTELPDGGTAVPKSTRFNVTIDLTALSSHPELSQERIHDTVDRLDARLTEVINV